MRRREHVIDNVRTIHIYIYTYVDAADHFAIYNICVYNRKINKNRIVSVNKTYKSAHSVVFIQNIKSKLRKSNCHYVITIIKTIILIIIILIRIRIITYLPLE